MKKGFSGYGFNLYSDKFKLGQFIWLVDLDFLVEVLGFWVQDCIVEVNGVCMEGKQYGDVVFVIRVGGDEIKLLVVDREIDEFFKKCRVILFQEYLNGFLFVFFINGEIQKENSCEVLVEVVLESFRLVLVRFVFSDISEELNF